MILNNYFSFISVDLIRSYKQHTAPKKKIFAKTGSVRNHQPISPYDHAASPQWDKISVTVYYRNLIRCLLELCN